MIVFVWWESHLTLSLCPFKIGNIGDEAQHPWVDSILASLVFSLDFGPLIWVDFEDAPVGKRIFLLS